MPHFIHTSDGLAIDRIGPFPDQIAAARHIIATLTEFPDIGADYFHIVHEDVSKTMYVMSTYGPEEDLRTLRETVGKSIEVIVNVPKFVNKIQRY